MGTLLERSFFHRRATTVAGGLLGMKLVSRVDGLLTTGMIVEVEAYCGAEDAAAHSFRGETARNRTMFQGGGLLYVYLIYGMHYCANVVTGKPGSGCAVLIRALEPLDGIETMRARRGLEETKLLTNGPARLCQALAIDRQLDGLDLLAASAKKHSHIVIEPYRTIESKLIERSPRIGISREVDRPWRFSLRHNPFVSRAPKFKR